MRRFIYLRNVATLALEEEKCNGCGMCLDVCPHAVFGTRERIVYIADRDACMECGACAVNCPTGALTVQAGVGCAYALVNEALGKGAVCYRGVPGEDGTPVPSAAASGASGPDCCS